jgi:hypothetical protein
MMWFSDGRRLLTIAIVFATLVGAWMFRYEEPCSLDDASAYLERPDDGRAAWRFALCFRDDD